MNELLIRIETLCLGVKPPILLGVGAAMAVVGLVLWLGGTRYSTIVIGLLGAAVGAFLGLATGQQLGINPLIGLGAGGLILGVASILLRNVLIIVLATIIFALLAAGGYAGVLLDRQSVEQAGSGDSQTVSEGQSSTDPSRSLLFQSFGQMNNESRQAYLKEISGAEEKFQDKLVAILKDTWNGLGPYKWYLLGAIVVGGVGGFLLIWFIKQVIVPLCYSVVGTATLLLGAQLLLLAVEFRAASSLPPQRWIMPTVFGAMSVVGWGSQLLAARKPRAKAPRKRDEEDDDE